MHTHQALSWAAMARPSHAKMGHSCRPEQVRGELPDMLGGQLLGFEAGRAVIGAKMADLTQEEREMIMMQLKWPGVTSISTTRLSGE
jgi:hypothetical protein